LIFIKTDPPTFDRTLPHPHTTYNTAASL